MKTLLTILGILLAAPAYSQVYCSQIGSSMICDGPTKSTTITEFSRGQGVITDSTGRMDPYTIAPSSNDDLYTPRSSGIEPLRTLPSLEQRSPSSHPSPAEMLLPLGY